MTLRDLHVVELSDLLDAEQQMLRELPLMASRATSGELRALFDDHYRDTQRHIRRLEAVFTALDERPRASSGDGMRGIIVEARERHAVWDPGTVLDTALAGLARRLKHYEIAAYECAVSHAAAIGHPDAAALLRETLDEERGTDSQLSELFRRCLLQPLNRVDASVPLVV
jgi:ferritin-like metal-binding protein YciE